MRRIIVACLLTTGVCFQTEAQSRPRILIDATRGSSPWWFRPPGNNPYQGQRLTEYLQRRGDVEALGKPPADRLGPIQRVTITEELLAGRALVLLAGPGIYTDIKTRILDRELYAGEIGAYHEYVTNGGRLLIMLEYMPPGQTDGLAASFGLRFAGASIGDNRIDRFVRHPITRGVRAFDYRVGSGLIGDVPPGATVLGFLSGRTALDLNANRQREAEEPTGAGVFGVLEFGSGVVFFIGDINTLQVLPQPFTDNLFDFLLDRRK